MAFDPSATGAGSLTGEAASADQFLENLAESGLYSPAELRELTVKIPAARRGDGKTLARELVRLRKLTRYQAAMLYQGRTRGLRLENYCILDKLGQGGMGMVFKARHQRLGRVVALKVLPPGPTKVSSARQRFQREVQATSKLNHPNIVQAFDASEADGVHFLVMEFVDGNDLSRQVKEHGPLPVDLAVECIVQAARGLEHAHAVGIIHRDIKPSNLLLCREQPTHVKVLDLGLARIDAANAPGSAGDDLTRTGNILGTCDFMSPEQALNTKNADQRSDIYSLGCTLWFLLTGRPMFAGDTAMEKILAHRETPAPSLRAARPEVSAALDAVFRRMVAKRPEDRQQSMTEVLVELSGGQGRPAVRRKRKWLLAGALTGAVAVVLLVILAQSGSEPQPVLAIPGGETRTTSISYRPNLPASQPNEAWLQQLAELPAEQQGAAVAAKLRELNAGFDGQVAVKLKSSAVVDVEFCTDHVRDISPLQVLTGLTRLSCSGKGRGQLTDLAPLRGLPITELNCSSNPELRDLSPLAGTPLRSLTIFNTAVEDLGPLRGAPLGTLACSNAPVRSLEPLRDSKLGRLYCNGTKITDLGPLATVPIVELNIKQTPVTSLAPLLKTPLRSLLTDLASDSDLRVLAAIPALEKINGEPAADFLRKRKAK